MTLVDWKTTADIVEAAITSLAIVAGGSWAYFRFVRNRTLRPRVEAEVEATWLDAELGSSRLLIRVLLKNIGASKVDLLKDPAGRVVAVGKVAESQPEPPHTMCWSEYNKVYEVFDKHQWIEPGEKIAYDLLIRLPIEPQAVRVRARIVLARRLGSNIAIEAMRILTSTSLIGETSDLPDAAGPRN